METSAQMKSPLSSLADEFRIYARAECEPRGARWTEWADTLEAADHELHEANAEVLRLRLLAAPAHSVSANTP